MTRHFSFSVERDRLHPGAHWATRLPDEDDDLSDEPRCTCCGNWLGYGDKPDLCNWCRFGDEA